MQRGLAPDASPALDRVLLAAAPGRERGVLRVYDLAGTVLSLGRYHLMPAARAPDVALQRRLSGGRVAAAGTGFVGVALVLPHRAALVAEEPSALAPEQVINRCVRGVLEGLQLLGVGAFYPGRDALTVGGRTMGLCGFEVDAAGACIFEVILGVGRDLSVLPALLDAADPAGVVPASIVTAADATSVGRESGHVPATEELADALRRGYESRMGVRCEESASPTPATSPDPAWLAQRRVRPELDRRARVTGQLGALEVHCRRDGDRLGEVMLSGDFFASSPAVERLEEALRGALAEEGAIRALVERAFASPDAFLLGFGSLDVLADTIVHAAGP